MMLKINKKGFWFEYKEDHICLNWFWHKPLHRYYSEKLHHNFHSLKDYREYSVSNSDVKHKNILGFDTRDIIEEWVEYKFSKEYVVVLMDINISEKSMEFWEGIPYTKKIVFSKEIIVLKCKDFRQVSQIIESVEREFAIALGFKAGNLVVSNDY